MKLVLSLATMLGIGAVAFGVAHHIGSKKRKQQSNS